jgi:hypothetical protein
MRKIFLSLLRKYSQTESQRMEIYKELWHQVEKEYSEQTLFGNVYNMNIEVLMSNPFFVKQVLLDSHKDLEIMQQGLSDSFDKSVGFVKNEKNL